MYLEDKEPVSPIRFVFSFILLTILIFTFYYWKDRAIPKKEKLQSIKSVISTEMSEKFTGPIQDIALKAWKSLTRTDMVIAYVSFIAIVYSLFLHFGLLLFERYRWKLNHHILLYSVAFLPLSIYVPYQFVTEMISAIFIISLILTCKLETLLEIGYLVLFSILSFLTHSFTFVIGFSIFTSIICVQKLQEDRSRTLVFYKKKSIAGWVLLGYFAILFLILIILSSYHVFGENSFRFLFGRFKEMLFLSIPIIGLLFLTSLFMKTERELDTKPATVIFAILLGIAVFFSNKKISPVQAGLNTIDESIQEENEPE